MEKTNQDKGYESEKARGTTSNPPGIEYGIGILAQELYILSVPRVLRSFYSRLRDFDNDDRRFGESMTYQDLLAQRTRINCMRLELEHTVNKLEYFKIALQGYSLKYSRAFVKYEPSCQVDVVTPKKRWFR